MRLNLFDKKNICLKIFIALTCGLHFSCINAQENNPVAFISLLENARKATTDKRWEEALNLWQQATVQNPVNGEYWSNLGSAYYNNKQYDKSIEAYKKQIELGWGLTYNAAYNIACCYALSGQKEPALEWLQKAYDMGFVRTAMVQTDTDLDAIRGEAKFKKLTGTDDVTKMSRTEGWRYDLALIKQEVLRKAFLRRELSLDEFNKQYTAIYNSIDKKTDQQIILGMMKLMVTVNDGHSSLFPPAQAAYKLTLPLQFYFFTEGLYIVAADEKYKHLLGNKVINFGQISVDKVAKTLSPYINRDNEIGVVQRLQDFVRHAPMLHALKLIPDPAKVELELMDRAGKISKAIIVADTSMPRVDHKSAFPANWVSFHQTLANPVPLYLKNPRTNYWFEKLPDSKIVYMQFNSVRNDKAESLSAFAERLMKFTNENDVEKLVIDLRWNNGGNTMLLPPFINALIKNEKINKRGNLFVITGRRTFSAAQNLATYLEKQTAATFVGEPTGSSPNFVGEEDYIMLPYSKVNVNVSDLFWQSSWPGDKRTWIAPALYIPPTFKAYSANRDEALEAIVNWSKGSTANKTF
ncbi:MAG: S41 family peptidase [Bacteroidota bacterium]|nr:S41 family peptidase [Bacteroidota bacterium]